MQLFMQALCRDVLACVAGACANANAAQLPDNCLMPLDSQVSACAACKQNYWLINHCTLLKIRKYNPRKLILKGQDSARSLLAADGCAKVFSGAFK